MLTCPIFIPHSPNPWCLENQQPTVMMKTCSLADTGGARTGLELIQRHIPRELSLFGQYGSSLEDPMAILSLSNLTKSFPSVKSVFPQITFGNQLEAIVNITAA